MRECPVHWGQCLFLDYVRKLCMSLEVNQQAAFLCGFCYTSLPISILMVGDSACNWKLPFLQVPAWSLCPDFLNDRLWPGNMRWNNPFLVLGCFLSESFITAERKLPHGLQPEFSTPNSHAQVITFGTSERDCVQRLWSLRVRTALEWGH